MAYKKAVAGEDYGTFEGGRYVNAKNDTHVPMQDMSIYDQMRNPLQLGGFAPRMAPNAIAMEQEAYMNSRGRLSARQYENDLNAQLRDPESKLYQMFYGKRTQPTGPSSDELDYDLNNQPGAEGPMGGDVDADIARMIWGTDVNQSPVQGAGAGMNAVQNDPMTVAMLVAQDAFLSPIAMDVGLRGIQKRGLGMAGRAVAGGFRPGATGARMTAGRMIGGLGKRAPLLTAASAVMEGADRSREFGGDSFGGQFGKAVEGSGNSLTMGGLDAVLAALPTFMGGQGINESDEAYYNRTGRTADTYGTRSWGEALGNYLFPQIAPPLKQTYQRPTPYGL